MNPVTRYERVASWNPNAERNTHTQQWELCCDDAETVPTMWEILGWSVLGTCFVVAVTAFLFV